MLDQADVRVGNYVLIHVGFAMSKVDEVEAEAAQDLHERTDNVQPSGDVAEVERDGGANQM